MTLRGANRRKVSTCEICETLQKSALYWRQPGGPNPSISGNTDFWFILIYYVFCFPYIMTSFAFINMWIMWGLFRVEKKSELHATKACMIRMWAMKNWGALEASSKQSSLVVSNNVQLSLKEACSDMFCWRLNSEGILWSWSFSFDHGHEFTARCSRRGWAFQWLWAMVLKQNRDIILCLPLETAFGQCQLNLTSTCETATAGTVQVRYKQAMMVSGQGWKNSEFMWHSVGNT